MSHAVGTQPEQLKLVYQQLIAQGLPLTHIQQHVKKHMLEFHNAMQVLNEIMVELEDQPAIRQQE